MFYAFVLAERTGRTFGELLDDMDSREFRMWAAYDKRKAALEASARDEAQAEARLAAQAQANARKAMGK